MIAQEMLDGKDRPGLWRMEHEAGLWAMSMATEEFAQQGSLGNFAGSEQGPTGPQWQSSRSALWYLCHYYRRGASPESIPWRLGKEQSGKPLVWDADGQSPPVAIAHTVGMGCAAMGLHKSIVGIGVDVERVSDRFLRVCPRISNQADGDQVFRSGIVQDEAEGAALIWVIKEACFKAALDQDNLFGYNQLIKKIERTSTLADMRWRGQVISGKGDSKEKWEFEAGCLAHGVDHEGSKPGDGNLSSIMPWIWAVAWANG